MIDVSNYKKIGECRDGKILWLSPENENIVYLMVFGNSYYVGSSFNLRRRFSQCVPALRRGDYMEKIQVAYDVTHSFDLYVIETSTSEDLRNREEYWIITLNPLLNTHVYSSKNMKLRFNIKKRIKALGWTQERLAAEMTDRTGKKGITQSALEQMLNGDPGISRLQQIADIIGVPLSELVADDTETDTHHQVCPHCGKPIKVTLE